MNETKNLPTSGLAIAGLVVGILSFIPFVGLLLGIIAIILGWIGFNQIKNKQYKGQGLAKAGIILGILGILFTNILGFCIGHYMREFTKSEYYNKMAIKSTPQEMSMVAGSLELYKKKYGKYPRVLAEATKEGFTFPDRDLYQRFWYYEVSPDGLAYELRSLGRDGIYGSSDNIQMPKS